MLKRSLLKHLATAATLAALAPAALAQAATEISFYYPVAIGGPVTKIIDE
jgi:sn-glycerol 3-phosphate transport system substrate-binding protein